MSEVEDIKLVKVGQSFPVGTVVGLYPGLIPDSGVPRPAGESISTATVQADESLTFAAVTVTQPTYFAAAKVAGAWRLIQRTQKAGEVPAIIAMGERGVPGANGTNGTNGAPGTNGTNGTNGAAGAKGETGAAGLSAAPFQVQMEVGEHAGVGGSYFAQNGGKVSTIGIATNAALVYLKAGTKYKARALFGVGEHAPAVAHSIGILRVTGMNNQFFAVGAEQVLITTAKLTVVKTVTELENEFEVATSGWYAVKISRTEETVATSSMAVAVSIGQ